MGLLADLAGIKVGDAYPVRIVGVINVSPESFYKSSVKTSSEEIATTAVSMVKAGADIIDIGAMSTAPYLQTEISTEEETKRLVSAIKAVKEATNIPVSADTTRSQPAEAAIKAGADILNDVSGLKSDEKMAKIVAKYDVPLIIVAKEKQRGKGAPMERVITALKQSLNLAQKAGVSLEKVVIDPGIGFFRHTEVPWYLWDCNVIRNLEKLRVLKRPIHIGVSRKSFIGKILNQDKPEQRLHGSLSATAIAVFNGAHMVRTHDIAPTIEVVRLAEQIRKIGQSQPSLRKHLGSNCFPNLPLWLFRDSYPFNKTAEMFRGIRDKPFWHNDYLTVLQSKFRFLFLPP
jgi:dihydropteroate synthase